MNLIMGTGGSPNYKVFTQSWTRIILLFAVYKVLLVCCEAIEDVFVYNTYIVQ